MTSNSFGSAAIACLRVVRLYSAASARRRWRASCCSARSSTNSLHSPADRSTSSILPSPRPNPHPHHHPGHRTCTHLRHGSAGVLSARACASLRHRNEYTVLRCTAHCMSILYLLCGTAQVLIGGLIGTMMIYWFTGLAIAGTYAVLSAYCAPTEDRRSKNRFAVRTGASGVRLDLARLRALCGSRGQDGTRRGA